MAEYRLKFSEQQQDQQNHDHKAQPPAAIISGPVERTAADAAEAAEQGDDENDQNDGADRHLVLLSPNGAFMLCPSREPTTGSHLSSVLHRDNARGPSFRSACDYMQLDNRGILR